MRARRRSRRPRSAARRGPRSRPGRAHPDRCRSREPPTLLKGERSIAGGRGPRSRPGRAHPDRCRSREPPTLLKVERSIAEGRDAPGSSDLAVGRARPVAIGLGIAVLALVLYVLGNGERLNFYNHFAWQADAFLHGRGTIPYPVPEGASDEPFNDYFQYVLPVHG